MSHDFSQPSASSYTAANVPRYETTMIDPPRFADASALLGDGVHTLSAEGLLLYLETRLNSIDAHIDQIFEKQQKNEYLRKQLLELQKTLAMFDENPSNPTEALHLPTNEAGETIDLIARLDEQINAMAIADPELAADIRADLTLEGQVMYKEDSVYRGYQVTNSKEYVQGLSKQLETGSQLDMMQLQSLMSTRQTAIQLATGMTASYHDAQKAVVSNIR